ncbi:Hpt domain-containing protein [Fulvivirgaceae bacterium BMA10]|uniref:Hpt domain-containing protein n=1 Tax=Splendidivirga corallicola TaxID=3051826 RepID=A0ABT8KJY7_9BACT|nr:Hpt domain-containing protein [Fulvivirgaceae bacterium BMA10]
MENKKLLDLSYLEQVCGANKAIVAKMIDMFVEQTPKQLAQMHEFFEKESWEELFKVAHKTKSSLAMMGARSIEQELQDLEQFAAKKMNLEQIPGLIETIEATCKELLSEIEEVHIAVRNN